MINIVDKAKCCGCEACAQICPHDCIKMGKDEEGFLYPHIVKIQDCINCNLCNKVCPVEHQRDSVKPITAYAAINRNLDIRLNSSSGGIFYALSKDIINKGGLVFGVKFNSDWGCEFDSIKDIESIKELMGSKYLQAKVNDIFKKIKHALEQNKQVLFTGTPCQNVALKNYLRNEYKNLICIDFICHGVPSPSVWERYLNEEIQGKAVSDDNNNKLINNITFRDKCEGWKRFKLTIKRNKDSISQYHRENYYMNAFLNNLILRPSCHNCPAKNGKSNSDITIADCWGISNLLPEIDDDRGISLVLINTQKGNLLYQQNIDIESQAIQSEKILEYNKSYYTSSKHHFNRRLFFKDLKKHKCLKSIINRCLEDTIINKIRRRINNVCHFHYY